MYIFEYCNVLNLVHQWSVLYECCTANAAGEQFALYFHGVVEALKVYLVNTETEDQRKVQIQAIGKFLSSLYAFLLIQIHTILEAFS